MKTAQKDAHELDKWVCDTLDFSTTLTFEEALTVKLQAIKLEAFKAGLERAASIVSPYPILHHAILMVSDDAKLEDM